MKYLSSLILFFQLVFLSIFSAYAEENKDVCLDMAPIVGSIGEDSLKFLFAIQNGCLQKKDGPPLELKISSSGGEAYSGFAGYDILKNAPARSRLIITGYGEISSSAISVFLGAVSQNRQLSCNAVIFLHDPTLSFASEARLTRSVLEDQVIRLAYTTRKYTEILAAETGNSVEVISELMRSKYQLTAQEAVKYGFANKVIGCE